MNARSLIVPGLVFFAGALFGRMFGVKPLVKGAMAAAGMSGMIPDTSGHRRSRRIAHRPRRRTARRSAKAA
jgi:hypothetical protein